MNVAHASQCCAHVRRACLRQQRERNCEQYQLHLWLACTIFRRRRQYRAEQLRTAGTAGFNCHVPRVVHGAQCYVRSSLHGITTDEQSSPHIMVLLPIALTVAAVVVGSMGYTGLFRKKTVSFKDRHVLITGGSTGIGEAIAEELAKQGAHVSLVARSQAKLDAAKAQITAAASGDTATRIHTFSADVTNADDVILCLVCCVDPCLCCTATPQAQCCVSQMPQVQRMVRDAEAAQGPIYCLISNAGSSTPGALPAWIDRCTKSRRPCGQA